MPKLKKCGSDGIKVDTLDFFHGGEGGRGRPWSSFPRRLYLLSLKFGILHRLKRIKSMAKSMEGRVKLLCDYLYSTVFVIEDTSFDSETLKCLCIEIFDNFLLVNVKDL